MMLRYLSAGESHGKGLTAIIEGLPAGFLLDKAWIDQQLAKRQGGYGRGGRMKIEHDEVEFLAGLRNGLTMGSPLCLMIHNRDWANWEEIMNSAPGAAIDEKQVTLPRPGHADLAGGIKYRQKDLRNILERASARETAIRVAVGAVAQSILSQFGISVRGHVVSLGGIQAQVERTLVNEALYDTPLYCTDAQASERMTQAIDQAKAQGDSLGGVVEVLAEGLPIGLGSHVQPDRKLDGRLAQALMSIQAIKGVEIGGGFQSAYLPGSQVHDEIFYAPEQGYYHQTNHCGGLEGGMTNGETLIIRAAMKPIPTLYKPLHSVDWLSKKEGEASVERSDACAVPAAAIVAENAVAWTILDAFLEKFSGDHADEIMSHYQHYLEYVRQV